MRILIWNENRKYKFGNIIRLFEWFHEHEKNPNIFLEISFLNVIIIFSPINFSCIYVQTGNNDIKLHAFAINILHYIFWNSYEENTKIQSISISYLKCTQDIKILYWIKEARQIPEISIWWILLCFASLKCSQVDKNENILPFMLLFRFHHIRSALNRCEVCGRADWCDIIEDIHASQILIYFVNSMEVMNMTVLNKIK